MNLDAYTKALALAPEMELVPTIPRDEINKVEFNRLLTLIREARDRKRLEESCHPKS